MSSCRLRTSLPWTSRLRSIRRGTTRRRPRAARPADGRPGSDPGRSRHPVGGRRGARGSRTEDGRRYSTAGNGLVVGLLALVFGALLMAPGMHKTSFNGQPGLKRDVSLALTGGLAHVSHALLLDRPRGLVQDAMGRGDADQINVAIVVPPTTVTPKPGTTPDAEARGEARPSRSPLASSRSPPRRSCDCGSPETPS